MTFTSSIASKSTTSAHDELTMLKAVKLSKISVATSLLVIIGVTIFQNLLLMSASHPAELNATQKQVLAASHAGTAVK
jgi:hypothetical protein